MPKENKYVTFVSVGVFPKEVFLCVCYAGYATVDCLYKCKISVTAVLA
jgi:hypothetical protein